MKWVTKASALRLASLACFANTTIVVVLSGFLGGVAVDSSDPTHFYLVQNGARTEVSQRVHTFLKTEKWIVIVTLPLFAQALWYGSSQLRKSRQNSGQE